MQTRRLSLAGAAIALVVGSLAIAQDEPKPAEPADNAPEKAERAPAPEADEAAPAAGEGEAAPSAEAPAQEPAEAPSAEPAEVDEPDPAEEARRLVKQLADESYQAREEAMRKLWGLGEVGMDALEKGSASDDPEVAYRSRILLQRIRTGITPETPPEVVELVQRYFRSGVSGKKDVFEDLQEEKAYVQMLRLYRFESDAAAREACEDVLSKALLPAVLEKLVEGELEAAEELLRLAPATDQNCRRLAALLRVQGKLDEELRRTSGELAQLGDGPIGRASEMDVAAMHLALLRSKGRTAEAKELASRMERDDLVASLSLFEGDARPYLRWIMQREDESPIVRVHAEAVLKRWEGDTEGAAKLMNNMAREAREGGDDVEREAMLSLLLNGAVDLALPILMRENRDSAFGYFETLEEPLKALETKGYVGTREEKQKWLDERLKAMEGDWLNTEQDRFDVLTVASFLHTRGEHDESRRLAFALAKLAEGEGEETWLEFLGRLHDFGGSLHELGFIIAAERLGDDDKDELAPKVIGALFGEGDSPRRFWDRLEETEKGAASERLLVLGAMYGAVHLEIDKLMAALARLRQQAEEGEPDDRVQILAGLFEAAEAREDAGTALELLRELTRLDDPERWQTKLAGYLAYVSEWDQAVELLEKILAEEPQNMRYLALYGGALIRAGQPDKAAEPLRDVERFSLDEPIRLLRLALDLERSGVMDESADYWRTLIMTNPPSDWYWQSSAHYMARHAKREKQWWMAAAFAEVDAMQYIKGRSTYVNPVTYLRKRFTADLFRGLALLEDGERERALTVLRGCFELMNGDGLLADDYFPLLREAGLTDEHDRNFEIVYQRLEDSIKAFPKAHNTYNSAAWIASRANRRLDDAHEKIKTALAMRPKQAAYLDTMAEVWFAKGDREKAVEWSRKAVRDSFHSGFSNPDSGVGLREQYDRFREADFPVP